MDEDFINFVEKETKDFNMNEEQKLLSKMLHHAMKPLIFLIKETYKINKELGKRLLLTTINTLLLITFDNFDNIYEILNNCKEELSKTEKLYNKNE